MGLLRLETMCMPLQDRELKGMCLSPVEAHKTSKMPSDQIIIMPQYNKFIETLCAAGGGRDVFANGDMNDHKIIAHFITLYFDNQPLVSNLDKSSLEPRFEHPEK